jgi:LuxR family transcriptional regulator, maltose regulon positive regulatory protein
MAGERILVVDDAEGVRKLLRTSLAREGFVVRFAGSGEEGLEAIRREAPDLVVLDLMLPAMDGLEVCRRLKAETKTRAIPVIMLTGRGEEADVIRGLEMGADDYMIKPFSPRVLIARLRAVLRRRSEGGTDPVALRLHDLRIDTACGEVWAGTKRVPLSHPEFRFLHLLASAALADDRRPEPQLNPLADGDSPPDPERLFEREGMTLFALNRLGHLAPLLVRMPESLLLQLPWLALFSGLVRFHMVKGDFLGALEAARKGFIAAGERRGELLAVAQLLLVQALFPGEPAQRALLAERAEELADAELPGLCSYAQIHVAQCLALAGIFHGEDRRQVTRYQELALTLVEQQDLASFGALAYFCNGYQALRRGDLKGLLRLLERADPLLQSPLTSVWERALLRLLQLYALLLQGDDVNRQRLLARMEAKFDLQLLERSLLRSELGLHEVVSSVLGRHSGQGAEGYRHWLGAAPAAFRHRFLALGALAALRTGEPAEAGALLAAARPLLGACRDRFDRAWCGMLLGAVGLLLGAGDPREDLAPALAAAAELGNPWLATAVSGVLLACDREEGGEIGEALGQWLTPLSRDGGLGLRCSPPEIRRRLLDAAVELGLAPAARPLAASLGLVVRDGEAPLPLLEVQTLGGIGIQAHGRPVVRAEDLSPAQRELLALLVAVPEMKLSQEEVQLDFWPDSPAEKARSSFDSLLLRLRKTLDTALAPHAARDYLQLQKGILSLDNVRVDAHAFAGLIRLGLDLVRRREPWQAGNAFARAHALWKGPFMPGASARDHAADYREELDLLYVVGMQAWAELLMTAGQTETAEEILLQALRIDRINDQLVKTLCRCHLRSNNPIKARQVIQGYAENLRREDYSHQEIEQILATFPAILKGFNPPA